MVNFSRTSVHAVVRELELVRRALNDAAVPVLTSPNGKGKVVGPLIQAASDSCVTFEWLAAHLRVRDAYAIARVVFETLLNAAFVAASDPSEAERAMRHANQKAFRDLDRDVRIGAASFRVRWPKAPDPSTVPGLEDALREFTGSKGQELRDWTSTSVTDRIVVIEARFGRDALIGFHFALAVVYRHSSEILHGTFFGALYGLCMTEPRGVPTTVEDLEERQATRLCCLAMMLALAIDSAFVAFGQEFDVASQAAALKEPIERLLATVKRLTKPPRTDQGDEATGPNATASKGP